MFNKAPVKISSKKKRKTYEFDVPDLPKKKADSLPEENVLSDTEMQEGQIEVIPASKRVKQGDFEPTVITRIRRQGLSRGTLVFGGVLEVTKHHIMVGYGRNKRGYVASTDFDGYNESIKHIKAGDFLCCTVVKCEEYKKDKGFYHRTQLTMNPNIFNACLNTDCVVNNMIIPALVSSVEEKGYLLEFGFSDSAQGFLKFTDCKSKARYSEKTWVLVGISKISKKSKLISCVEIRSGDNMVLSTTTESISLETMKPGSLVQASVKQVLTNGLYVHFLRGIEGTILEEHLVKPPELYKLGEKLHLRMTVVNVAGKSISLSELPHMVKLSPISEWPVHIGKLTGEIGSIPMSKTESIQSKSESVSEISSVQAPIDIISWTNLEVGQIVTGKIEKAVNNSHLVIKLNDNVMGFLPLEQMTDRVVSRIPEKLKEPGKLLRLRVFSLNRLTKKLVLTRKKLFLKQNTPIIMNRENIKIGQEAYGVVRKHVEGGFIIKFMNEIIGFLQDEDIPEEVVLKPGQTLRVFVGYNHIKQEKIGLSLSEEGAKKLFEKQSSQDDELTQMLINSIQIDINHELPPGALDSIEVGTLLSFRCINSEMDSIEKESITINGKYLIMKTVGLEENFYAYIPYGHLSDNKQHIEKLAELFSQSSSKNETQYEGLILNIISGTQKIIIASIKPSLVRAKKNNLIPSELQEISEGSTYVGHISKIIEKGVFVSFLGSLKGFLSNGELENNAEKKEICWIGKALRVAVTRSSVEEESIYLSTKRSKIYSTHQSTQKGYKKMLREVMLDLKIQIIEFFKEQQMISAAVKASTAYKDLHYGDYVKGTVQMIKDYGLIVQCKDTGLTGYIMNEHKRKKKEYTVGQEVVAKILDIDKETNLLDLSHGKHYPEFTQNQSHKPELTTGQHEKILPLLKPRITKFPKAKSLKARVELIKDSYAIVSLSEFQYVLAIMPIRLFNRDEKEVNLNKLSIGNSLNVKLCGYNKSGPKLLFAVPALTNLRKIWDTDHIEISSKAMPNIEIDVDTLHTGQQITGKISSIQGNTCFVHINRKIVGRLHKAQCDSAEKFAEFHKDSVVSAYIFNITKKENEYPIKVDLSLVNDFSIEIKKGQKMTGVIKAINWENSYPIIIELCSFLRAMVYFKDVVNEPLEISTMKKTLKENQFIECFSHFSSEDIAKPKTRLAVSLIEQQSPTSSAALEEKKIGDLVLCRCINAKPGQGVAVQLGENETGLIDITELSDKFDNNQFTEVKKRGVFAARILEILEQKEKNKPKYKLSARPSICDQKLYKILSEAGAFEFQQHFDYITEEGDMRSKILKFGIDWIKPGNIGLGYISNINDKGCFIKVSMKLTVRASLTELSDAPLANPLSRFKINDIVLFRVVSVTEPKKVAKGSQPSKYINVSLRESIVKYGLNLGLADLRVGQVYSCIARKYEMKGSLRIQIKGSTLIGMVKGAPMDLQAGELVYCKIEKIETEKDKHTKIKLKFESKDTSSEPSKLEELFRKIEQLQQESTEEMKEVVDFNPDNDEIVCIGAPTEKFSQSGTIKPEELEIIEPQELQSDSDAEELKEIQETYHEEDSDEEEPMEVEGDQEEPMEDIESSEGENKPKKTKTAKSISDKIKEERKLRHIELQNQTNSEDFEKQIAADPNNSFIWLQYVAFLLDNAGVDSARRLIKRALSQIDIAKEQEKLNVWIGYLNLESTHGTSETLQEVAKKAIEVNDKKKIYKSLVNIYFCSGRYEYALDVLKQMIKKFHNSIGIWIIYTDILFKLAEILKDPSHDDYKIIQSLSPIAPREALSRALQAVDKNKHIKLISKYGQQEYKYGNIENGRTMFEGIVSSYPNKTDVWGIYFDMEIKYGGTRKDYIRNLFERCLKLDIKEKKMQFFYKKYLDFELAYGTEQSVANLKEKITQLVQAHLQKQKDFVILDILLKFN